MTEEKTDEGKSTLKSSMKVKKNKSQLITAFFKIK